LASYLHFSKNASTVTLTPDMKQNFTVITTWAIHTTWMKTR
jgi:hypothetical protein